MSKTPSEKLFRLIKSMTKSEKRYFKVFAGVGSASSENKYFQLFLLINKQNVYDEGKLKKKIYQNSKLDNMRFSELKNYLYEWILKSLRSFDQEKSVEYKIKSMLDNVRVLYSRALYDDCRDILNKAKLLSRKYETRQNQLGIINWEIRIAHTMSDYSFLIKNLEELTEEKLNILEELGKETKLQQLFFNILLPSQRDALHRNKETLDAIEIKMNDGSINNNWKGASYALKVLNHRINSIYFYSVRDYQNSYEHCLKLNELIDGNQHQLKEEAFPFIANLNNLIINCSLLGQYDELFENIMKLKNVKATNYRERSRILNQYYLHLMYYYTELGAFDEGVALVEEILTEKDKFKKNYLTSFYFAYAYIYFGVENYGEALYWQNKIIDETNPKEREDLHGMTRIMHVITHYELKNELLIEPLLRSTTRYLKRNKRMNKFEEMVIKTIRKSGKVRTKKEQYLLFSELKIIFKEMEEIPSEEPVFKYFDFTAWLESKLNKISFAEAVQERFRKRIS